MQSAQITLKEHEKRIFVTSPDFTVKNYDASDVIIGTKSIDS